MRILKYKIMNKIMKIKENFHLFMKIIIKLETTKTCNFLRLYMTITTL